MTGNVRTNVILRRISLTIFFRVKAISVTYSKCVSVALVIQYAKGHVPHYIFVYGLFGSTIFFHIIS